MHKYIMELLLSSQSSWQDELFGKCLLTQKVADSGSLSNVIEKIFF